MTEKDINKVHVVIIVTIPSTEKDSTEEITYEGIMDKKLYHKFDNMINDWFTKNGIW